MTKLPTALENAKQWEEDQKQIAKNKRITDNNIDIHSGKHLKKLLCYHEWIPVENPNIMLKFLPEGTMQIIGSLPKASLIYKWTLRHTPEDNYVLQTIPSLVNFPQDLLVIMSNDNIELKGLDTNNMEILHLIKHKIK